MKRAATVAIALAGLGGCADPCANLADRTCARVGEADPLCRQLREVAADPRPGEKSACESGIAFTTELEKH
jgi:hypothetical protein